MNVILSVLLSIMSVLNPVQWENRIQTQINAVRVVHGAEPVVSGGCVDRFAEEWADRLAQEDSMYHRRNLGMILERCNGRLVGEIIAMGATLPQDALRGWMASPPHREVMLNRKYQNVGKAVAQTDTGKTITVVLLIQH